MEYERSELHEVIIGCALSEEYFAEWKNLSQELKEFWEKKDNYCNCNGTGNIGIWCHDCPFGNVEEN